MLLPIRWDPHCTDSETTKNGRIARTAIPQSALEGFCLDCVRPNIIKMLNIMKAWYPEGKTTGCAWFSPSPDGVKDYGPVKEGGANLYSTWLQAEVGSAELYIKFVRAKPHGGCDGCFVLSSRWCSIPKTVTLCMFGYFSGPGEQHPMQLFFYLVWKVTGVSWKFNSVQYANMTVRRCERLKNCEAGAEGHKTLFCMTGGIHMFFACSVLVIKTSITLPKINRTASSLALLPIGFHVNVV